MCPHLRLDSLAVPVALVALLATSLAPPAVAETLDGLPAGRFDQEITIKMKDSDIVGVFRTLARLTNAPLILEFEPDPSLKVTFDAEGISLRAVLEALAGMHGLEYVPSGEGVLVRRKGRPPAAARLILGKRLPKPGPRYSLDLELRNAQGETRASPRIRIEHGSVATFKQGLEGARDVTVFDRARGIAEPRPIGGFELFLSITEDRGAELEIVAEVVVIRALGRTRYVEDHSVATHTVARGETLLVRTEDGHDLVLTGWSRTER